MCCILSVYSRSVTIRLTSAGPASVAGSMAIGGQMLTSTQIGAIGEAVIAAGLVDASAGQLSPFKPFADDDGTDLLVFDKVTRKATPVQIKCRTKLDDVDAGTVEFDVRLKTFAKQGQGFILAALLDHIDVRMLWLLPARDFDTIALHKADKLVIVPSIKPGARDRCHTFRHDSFESVARVILSASATPGV